MLLSCLLNLMDRKPATRRPFGVNWAMLFVAGILLAWEALSRAFELRPDLLPAPSRVVLELWRAAPLLREHGAVTCLEILDGLLLALAFALPIAIMIDASPRLCRIGTQAISFMKAAPLLIVMPLLIVWLGFGSLPKVLIVALLCFPAIAAGMLSGLRCVPRAMLDFLRTTNSGWLRSFWSVRLPTSLPGLFSGLRTATSLAVVGAAAGEFVGAEKGLGYVMIEGMARMSTPLVFAALVSLAAIAVVLHAAVVLLQSALVPASDNEKTVDLAQVESK